MPFPFDPRNVCTDGVLGIVDWSMNVISHWDGNRCVVKYELQLSQATKQAEAYVQPIGMWHNIVRFITVKFVELNDETSSYLYIWI